MSKYPTINYIGSKHKIVDWIVESMPLKEGTILDLFAGGCSVSYALKEKGYTVFVNDILYSNYVLAKAIIENNKVKLDSSFNSILPDSSDVEIKYSEIKDELENVVYHDYEVRELAKLVLISEQLSDYKKYLFLSLLRRAMIRKIPYSRMNVKWEEIVKFRDEEYSYRMYGRYRSYHNKPFIDHINKYLDEYNDSVFDNKKKNKAFNMDAFDLLSDSGIKKVDIIYLDPPYPNTMNNYESFYGKYDHMFGVHNQAKSDFSNKTTFSDFFKELLHLCSKKTKYIVISLNNKCKPSSEDIKLMMEPLCSEIKTVTKDYVYRVTGKENKNTNYEILLIGKVK